MSNYWDATVMRRAKLPEWRVRQSINGAWALEQRNLGAVGPDYHFVAEFHTETEALEAIDRAARPRVRYFDHTGSEVERPADA